MDCFVLMESGSGRRMGTTSGGGGAFFGLDIGLDMECYASYAMMRSEVPESHTVPISFPYL